MSHNHKVGSQPTDSTGRVIDKLPTLSRKSHTYSVGQTVVNVDIVERAFIAEVTVLTADILLKAKTVENATDVNTTEDTWDRKLLAGNTYSIYIGGNQGKMTHLSLVASSGTAQVSISQF